MRKTKTSSAVKRRYNDKTYDILKVNVRKEVAKTFKAYLEENGHTVSSVFHSAIHEYILAHEKQKKTSEEHSENRDG
jgi:hypothetical protein